MKGRIVLEINELEDIGVFDELLGFHCRKPVGRLGNDRFLF